MASFCFLGKIEEWAPGGRLGMAWLGLTRGGLCLKLDDGFESPMEIFDQVNMVNIYKTTFVLA